MEYEVYRHKDASDADFENINEIFKRVLAEDKWLCNNTQSNLNAGVYVNGQMHSKFEEGPLYFQSLVKQAVMEHRKHEEKLKREIWPASQALTDNKITEEMEFCSGLGCSSEKGKALDW
jgi:hypothetical protein